MDQMAEAATRDPAAGLSRDEVAARIASGAVNDIPQGPSRTVGEIVRANVVTRFNILLSALLVVILIVAPIQDALFGFVMIVNTAIGIVQELRAKQTLDQLALLSAPRARVVRDGTVAEVPVNQVVLDDVLEVHPGDQIVVDGIVVASESLEVDESLLTGESDPVLKQPGDECLSGSFGVAGVGRYQATRVGREAYAVRLAEEAKRFTLVRSELRSGIDWILAGVSWLLVPTAILLIWSQLGTVDSWREAMRASIAGMVAMVPQGLVLLTSVAFAVAVIRLGRRKVLVQELPAVEGLARVDVVCFDKTGTLTLGRLRVQRTEPLQDGAEPGPALGAVAAADPTPNATLQAVAAAFPDSPDWTRTGAVPFSSARKWSAASFAGRGTWVLGAPDVVLPGDAAVLGRADAYAKGGRRVLLLAHTADPLRGEALPRGLTGSALVILGDEVRSDAADTLRYFEEQGVAAKVISGDHAQTVSAIAAEVGIAGAERAVDGRELPESGPELARAVNENTVFGRVSPHQKRAMVQALQAAGHTVAMTGDGVNDVLALKDADIGVAMGAGSSASRAVAQIVLLEGDFDTLPHVVAEGRRVIANIERVANLFVTKTVYAVLLAFVAGVVGRVFPFVPRHLTLVGTITIGLPAFVLALAPTAKRATPGFIKRVLLFAIPTGTLAAAATFLAYEVAVRENVPVIEARTMATIVLASMGLFALIVVSRPLDGWRRALVGAMAGVLVLVLATPGGRTFFELDLPGFVFVLASIGIVSMAGAVMYSALRALGWAHLVPELLRTPIEATERWTMRLPRFARGMGPSLVPLEEEAAADETFVDPDDILREIEEE